MSQFRIYLLSAALLAGFSFSAAADATKVGVVGAANPLILVVSEEGVERELLAGDVIFLNDTIKTSESGSMQIMFQDRSAMTIAPNAVVKIDKFVFDPDTQDGEMQLKVATGAFRLIGGALSKKKPILVKTPVSTMGIRGGIMDGEVGEDGQTTGSLVHGNQLSMTDDQGNSIETTEPGSGLSKDAGNTPPKSVSRPQMRQRFSTPPVKKAFKMAPPASLPQLSQIDTQMDLNTPPTPPTRNTDNPKRDDTPDTPQNNDAPDEADTSTAPAADATTDGTTEGTNEQSDANESETPSDEETEQQANDTPNGKRPNIDDPLSDSEMNEVRRNPQSVLDKFPNGGPKMAEYVGKAIAMDPSLADDFSSIEGKANPAQAAAMGAGMARAGRLWNPVDPNVAGDLSKVVDGYSNAGVKRTFNAVGPRADGIGNYKPPARLPTPPLSNSPVGSEADKYTTDAMQQNRDPERLKRSSESRKKAQQKRRKRDDEEGNSVFGGNSGFGAAVTGVVVEDEVEENKENKRKDPVDDFVGEDEDDSGALPTSPSS